MKVSTLLIILVFFLSKVQAADYCLTVSGAGLEVASGKKAFARHYPLLKEHQGKVGGKNCEVFDDWDSLNARARQLPKGSSLMIIQGTHGIRDGLGNVSYNCNAKDIDADELLNRLEFLSANFSVGAVIDSCFSGNLMKEKLKRDLENKKSSEKLCLVTSSGMNRVAMDDEADLLTALQKAAPGQTLEDVYHKSVSGLISSAAWSGVGVDTYFSSKDFSETLKTLQSMDKIARNDVSPCDITTANSIICSDPRMTTDMFKEINSFLNKKMSDEDKLLYDVTYNGEKAANFKAYMTAGKLLAPVLEMRLRCIEAAKKYFEEKLGQNFSLSSDLTHFSDYGGLFKTDASYAVCSSYYQARNAYFSKEKNVDIKKRFSDYNNDDYLLYLSFSEQMKEEDKKEKKIRDLFNYHEPGFDVIKFAQHLYLNPSSQVCKADDKKKILASALGEEFFDFEIFEKDPGVAEDGISNDKISTSLMLKAFQQASLKLKEMPNNLDRSRRKACRDFKL